MDRALILILVGIGCLWIGYLEGRSAGTGKLKAYQAEQAAILAQAKADHDRQLQQYIEIGGEYYEKYLDAANREPERIVERVRIPVKAASCPAAPADTDRGMGAGAAIQAYAELHDANLKSLERFAQRAERDLEQCRIALHSVVEKVQAHNAQAGK